MNATSQKNWLEFGAIASDTGTQFRVWAPKPKRIELELTNGHRVLPMERESDDTYSAFVSDAGPGTRYYYLIEGQRRRPDPYSRFQPEGVHSASEVVASDDFRWSDKNWPGLPLSEYVIYELHVGAFSPSGNFEGVVEKLEYLRDAGITAVELMPVAEFEGERNWGYDGVNLFAPKSSYGGPQRLKALVDACHRLGMAACLDVVYNHLGPSGNYLAEFGPYFTDRYRTPWGSAINFDGPDSDRVRQYFVDNALYWITEYHFDALRLDAIHSIFDFGANHILEELAEHVHAQSRTLGRQCFLIAESDLDDPRIVKSQESGGYSLDSQWNDDFHHAIRSLLTGARDGYFVDFGRIADLAKAIKEGFVFDGRYSVFRRRRHGRSSADLPGERFVVFNQNHDQIANASGGVRASRTLSRAKLQLAAMVQFCAPNLPLLFMGEEFASTSPFFYFTSFKEPRLARAVSEGRLREVSCFGHQAEFIDPQSESAFSKSKIDWKERDRNDGRQMLNFYNSLCGARRTHRCLSNLDKAQTAVRFDEAERWLTIERRDADGSAALVLGNFSEEAVSVAIPEGFGSAKLALSNSSSDLPGIVGDLKSIRLSGWGAALFMQDKR